MHEQTSTIAGQGEFETIGRITASTERTATTEVQVGPGDDAAVVASPDGRVVISTDVYVEDRHFRRAWSGPEDIGHRVISAAVADVIAMGARPTSVVLGLACPKETPTAWVESFTRGVGDECLTAGAALVGGDLSRSNAIFVSVTALGDLGGRAPVLRSGARQGDVVAVVGTLGHAAAGLAILSRGFRSGKQFIDAHRRPAPPYAEGPRAAEAGASAMCDVSDGLVADLGHVAEASGVGIDLDSRAFEIPPRMAEIATALGADPLTWTIAGGDDHALVATFAPADVPTGWRIVGQVGGSPGVVTVDGAEPPAAGWTHFGG